MKKTLLIASLFAVALAACGKKEEAPAVAPVEETTTTALETTTTAGETARPPGPLLQRAGRQPGRRHLHSRSRSGGRESNHRGAAANRRFRTLLVPRMVEYWNIASGFPWILRSFAHHSNKKGTNPAIRPLNVLV